MSIVEYNGSKIVSMRPGIAGQILMSNSKEIFWGGLKQAVMILAAKYRRDGLNKKAALTNAWEYLRTGKNEKTEE